MIQMPRRSVTRFFIPLIDVLLLLFCIFLLMPIVNEEELKSKNESAAELSDSVSSLERMLQARTQELTRLEDLRPALDELERLREEVARLKKDRKDVVQRTYFQILDVDPKGNLYYIDPLRPDAPKLLIANEESAQTLIERHQRAAAGQEVYYYFLYPRPETGFPTLAQERQFKTWFAAVAHSLKERP
ncbi:MAG: hypothetical protein L0Y72_27165 [Gemmataceae bacterium]|nr:hypothetical protein [Gemmataceae bacterium]MCI0742732.1 hypothetical protein [Gemmataceae bacterium]